MKKEKILIYSNKFEPLTALMLHHSKNKHIYPISLNEFLDSADIFDEISNKEVNLRWTFPDGKIITNNQDVLLINRILGCNYELFDDYIKKDRDYIQSEFWAYLMFAINAFPDKTSSPSPYSLCGGGIPLPRQWIIAKALNISTPAYYLGHPSYVPKEWKSKEFVWTHIQNYYFWKVNKRTNTGFVFQKPTGTPFLVFITGKEASIHPMNNADSIQLPEKIQSKLKRYSLQINKTYKYPIAEALFFVDGTDVTFGMINNTPYASSTVNCFEERILNWIDTIQAK